MLDENKVCFICDYQDFIFFDFEKYYVIDCFGSLMDGVQFECFCDYIGINCDLVKNYLFFNYECLEVVFCIMEYIFDFLFIVCYYEQKIKSYQQVELCCNYIVQFVIVE